MQLISRTYDNNSDNGDDNKKIEDEYISKNRLRIRHGCKCVLLTSCLARQACVGIVVTMPIRAGLQAMSISVRLLRGKLYMLDLVGHTAICGPAHCIMDTFIISITRSGINRQSQTRQHSSPVRPDTDKTRSKDCKSGLTYAAKSMGRSLATGTYLGLHGPALPIDLA